MTNQYWKNISKTLSLSVSCLLSLSSFQEIPTPSLDDISQPPTYYTPNPEDPTGNWIVYDGYYEPTANRIWTPRKLSTNMTVMPTNDWFQTLATFPSGNVKSTTGYFTISWNGQSEEGISFSCPKAFQYFITPNVPLSGHFTANPSITPSNFSLIPTNPQKPQVRWEESDTGNMLRAVDYGTEVAYITQGSVFQGVEFKNSSLQIKIPSGVSLQTTSLENLIKYEITGSDEFTYLIYAPKSLKLSFSKGLLSTESLYTGFINITCIPTEQYPGVSSLLDAHAGAVIINALAAFSSSATNAYNYSFRYETVDFSGQKSNLDPLILLMDHQINKAQLSSIQKATDLSLLTLKGKLVAYAGSEFQFTFPDSYLNLSTDALPSPSITQTQAEALIDQKVLDRGLIAATAAPAPTLSIPYNKFIYQKALTLKYAQEIITISQRENIWQTELNALHQSLIEAINNLWKGSSTFAEKINDKTVNEPTGIRKDDHWGSLVFFPDSYGSAINLNDHIVQYGYPLYSLTLLDQYEEKAGISSRFLDQASIISSYTNKDLGNLLAADIGQSGKGELLNHRNLDFYEGHSWLSGIEKSNDGQNTESESEALFGSMSIVAWLEQTKEDPELIEIAKNRWLLETTSYESYWQVDPNTSPYKEVCPEYLSTGHLVSSMVWQEKITAETYWGLEWDRILGCVFMPASSNLLDNYLGKASSLKPIVSKEYAKAIANFVETNWDNYDTSNSIQSALIPLVARSASGPLVGPLGLPEVVQRMIDDVKNGKTHFDAANNELILTVIAMYAQNQISMKGN
jgi:endoglucanase Acf2